MKKLKHNKIQQTREQLLKLQNGTDPITGLQIKDPVLDHDHDLGHIRSVLQREVNSFEGKVINAYKRYIKHLGISPETALRGVIDYWNQDFTNMPLHPKFMTPNDKLRKLYRKRLKTAKTEKTKEKYRGLLKELQDEV